MQPARASIGEEIFPDEECDCGEDGFKRFQRQNLEFVAHDGVKLAASVFEPYPADFPGPRPALILVTPWVVSRRVYDIQAFKLANKGYIVFSYSPRGFGGSEGVVSIASPDDVKDVSSIVDALATNPRVDMSRIGIAGISYGAGISLLGLAHDARIKTAASVSGWADLEQAFFSSRILKPGWLKWLIFSGRLLGRLSPEVGEVFNRMQQVRDLGQISAWSNLRSPINRVGLINRRQAPVFLANSFDDEFFNPGQMKALFDQLTGPKLFYVDPGNHAISVIPGLAGFRCAVWDYSQQWFDRWLLGIDNGPSAPSVVRFKTAKGVEDLPRFPDPLPSVAMKPLNTLVTSGTDNDQAEGWIQIKGGRDSGATSGHFAVIGTLEALFRRPVRKKISEIDRNFAAVFESPGAPTPIRIRGVPALDVVLGPHQTPVELVAYLYSVDEKGQGTLLGYNAVTDREPRQDLSKLRIKFTVMAADIPVGHRLVVAMDTWDPMYENIASQEYPVSVWHSQTMPTTLHLPLPDAPL
jgi:hypothetical protein